ncbi:unnamed protein product, partial [Thlaspi arvense]
SQPKFQNLENDTPMRFQWKKPINLAKLRIENFPTKTLPRFLRQIRCSHSQNPKNTIDKPSAPQSHLFEPIILDPNEVPPITKKKFYVERKDNSSPAGSKQMVVLCGLGYWVQGFRGFPWLGLNFHMADNLSLRPSTLQLVQNAANLPMVVKPLYGILSDAIHIFGGHRIPYICLGVERSQCALLLRTLGGGKCTQTEFSLVLSWGSVAMIPVASEALPTLMACVLLSNLGASLTEVANDALIAEYGQKHKMRGLQSHAFMISAAGGILGNLLGGFFLLKTQQPKSMFLIFTALLAVQLAISLRTKEDSLGLPHTSSQGLGRKFISDRIRKQYSNLMMAVNEESISRPLIWIVASIAMVPILSGSVFCYQMQCLNLDPSVIGMSRVTGQLMLLSITILYDRFWKNISMRKLIGIAQISYAASLLIDLILVKQMNLKLGIPNEVFVLCFSGLAETLAQFKLLPFQVLFASLAPPGCEGSLTSFLASTLCLSSIVSGFLGVGLASLLGIRSGDYSSLPVGIIVQFLAALIPLKWIYKVPFSPSVIKEKQRGRSKRTRRNRRVGRVGFGSIYAYRRERGSESPR